LGDEMARPHPRMDKAHPSVDPLVAPVWRTEKLGSFNRWARGFTRTVRGCYAVEATLLSLQ